jgi:hypothetical protein
MLRAPVRLKCPVPGASAAMMLRLIVNIRMIGVFLTNIPPPQMHVLALSIPEK